MGSLAEAQDGSWSDIYGHSCIWSVSVFKTSASSETGTVSPTKSWKSCHFLGKLWS